MRWGKHGLHFELEVAGDRDPPQTLELCWLSANLPLPAAQPLVHLASSFVQLQIAVAAAVDRLLGRRAWLGNANTDHDAARR